MSDDYASLKRTPLYEIQAGLGARFVPFAGWELPVQYRGLIAEHRTVREKAGLFDVSHMGEIFVSGPEAEAALQYLTCNNVAKLVDGRAQYSAITTPEGGVVDDIIIYRFSSEHYMLCVNAANAEKDFNWLTSHNKFNAEFINRSEEFGQLALQGPLAEKILAKLEGGSEPVELKYFGFGEYRLAGIDLIVARTGYTGEDGFEFFVPKDQLATFWQVLMQAGEPLGLEPIGLGARDTLRLEACYPLHGHELSEDITAIESGLGWIVKPKKGDFIGREVLSAQKKEGAPRKLIGFFVEGRGIARHGDRILSNAGEELGVVTSGTKTPTVDRALGLALVRSSALNEGDHFKIEVRGRLLDALVVPTPFYKRTKR